MQASSFLPLLGDLRRAGNSTLTALLADALEAQTNVRQVILDGREYFMAGAPMKSVGWALLSVFDRDILNQPAEQMQTANLEIQQEAVAAYRENSARYRVSMLILLGIMLILLLAAALVMGRRIVKPLNTIIRRISVRSEGDLEFKMEDAFRTGDEIQLLAESFSAMSHKTIQYVDQVRTVTAEKERIGAELHMANQIQESMLPSIYRGRPSSFVSPASRKSARLICMPST